MQGGGVVHSIISFLQLNLQEGQHPFIVLHRDEIKVDAHRKSTWETGCYYFLLICLISERTKFYKLPINMKLMHGTLVHTYSDVYRRIWMEKLQDKVGVFFC